MSLLDYFRREPVISAAEYEETRTYDYATPEGRIATAEWLFSQARLERTIKEGEWTKFNDYYNFAHDVAKELAEAIEEQGFPFSPASVPDPYIMVESQIIPDIPQPEFHGRDDDLDSSKAKKRELAVRFVVENNRMSDMNTSNERRLKKFGDAFWKAYWDETMPFGSRKGDIRIKDISLEDIYPDPTAMELQECEYVDYVYTLHKNRFWRIYKDALKAQNKTLDDVLMAEYRTEDGLFDPYTKGTHSRDDMVQVLEHWFRQPFDAEDGSFESGDIACTIQAAGIELKYIPKYWEATGKQCKLYPFVHYWCIKDETQFYNKSELEPILPMVDAADRELAIGILNDAMTANDIVLIEEGALAPGEHFTNVPGSVINVKQGRAGGVARLGGLGSGVKSISMVEWMLGQIQRTNRNYDTNNGQETARVTTASGLLQLRSDAAAQQQLKKADRNAGFCRLYELIDWLCLEFYDDNRMLFIGAQKKGEEPAVIEYNSQEFAKTRNIVDVLSGTADSETIYGEPEVYYPRIDVTVTAGDALSKNPATTLEVLDKLAAINITQENWKLIAAELEYLDIPQKNDIIDDWKARFEPAVPQEVLQALQSDPDLLSAVSEAVHAGMQAPAGMQSQGSAQMLPEEDIAALAMQQAGEPAGSMGLPRL